MKFCDKCGSYMKRTKKGFRCRKCGNLVPVNSGTESKIVKKMKQPSLVYVVGDAEGKHAKVSQKCPKCGNNEAFHWFSRVSGEHAGVRRERTIEHFKCTKCSHMWTKTS